MMGGFVQYNSSSAATKSFLTNAVIAYTDNNGATWKGYMNIDSFIPDGVKLNVGIQFGSSGPHSIIFFGGDDLINVTTAEFESSAGVSPISVGFEPSLVFVTGGPGATNSVGNIGRCPLGVAINDPQESQSSVAFTHVPSASGTAGNVITSSVNNDRVFDQPYNGAAGATGIISNYSPTGFDFTGTDVRLFRYLAFEFANNPQLKIVDVTVPTSGDYVQGDIGFEPYFGMMGMALGVTARNTAETGNMVSYGVTSFTPTAIHTANVRDQSGLSTTSTSNLVASALRLMTYDTQADAILGSGYTFDANGWTHTLTTNPTSPVLGWGLAVGPTAAGGVTFDGPNIVAQSGTQDQVFTFDENGEGTVASRFTGATGYAISPDSSPLPAGLSVNATTGNVEGTPTESGTFTNIIIRGSDT
jgi:hypothetical protein